MFCIIYLKTIDYIKLYGRKKNFIDKFIMNNQDIYSQNV